MIEDHVIEQITPIITVDTIVDGLVVAHKTRPVPKVFLV
jgi:hypothetical protein